MQTVFDRIKAPIYIKTDRLEITDIFESDKTEYYNLYVDDELNKFWGYDYREDAPENPSPDFFYSFQNDLKEKKEEYSLAVRLEGKMIGELVLHAFEKDGLEIGFRLKKDKQKNGYAFESVSALCDFVFNDLNFEFIKGKCFLENYSSKKLFEKLKFLMISSDEKYYYFIKNKN